MGARTITATIDDLVSWVESQIAPQLEYNVPPPGGAVKGDVPVRDHPTVYPMFVPSEERLVQGQHQSPSIAVQMTDGNDEIRNVRTLDIRLILTIWSPGTFGGDGAFTRDMTGCRELFNGLDKMVAVIEAAETIADCALDQSRGISYGFVEMDKEIPDLWPYWMGRVDFRLSCGKPANKRFIGML